MPESNPDTVLSLQRPVFHPARRPLSPLGGEDPRSANPSISSSDRLPHRSTLQKPLKQPPPVRRIYDPEVLRELMDKWHGTASTRSNA